MADSKRVDFKEIGPNLYIVEFQDKNDLKKVQDDWPGSFDRYLFCIINFNCNLALLDFPFNRELF